MNTRCGNCNDRAYVAGVGEWPTTQSDTVQFDGAAYHEDCLVPEQVWRDPPDVTHPCGHDSYQCDCDKCLIAYAQNSLGPSHRVAIVGEYVVCLTHRSAIEAGIAEEASHGELMEDVGLGHRARVRKPDEQAFVMPEVRQP